MIDMSKSFEAELKKAFEDFQSNSVESFRVKLRRVRAEQMRELLSDPNTVDLALFNSDVWPFESETRHGGEVVTGLSFRDTLSSDKAAELEEWLDAGELEFHGNYVWGSGAGVYGAKLTDSEEEKTLLIRQAVQILNDEVLTPLQKAQAVCDIRGFGPNIGSGLVMLLHPNEFAIWNKQSKEAMSTLGHRIEPLEEFQNSIRSLRDTLGAKDFLELDWFLYLINQGRTKLPKLPRFWWVNQGQTSNRELEEQFIWAPQQNKKGTKFYHWTNVSKVRKGDVLINYARKAIRGVSVAKRDGHEADRPEFLPTNTGLKKGWRVDFNTVVLEKPISLEKIPLEERISEGGPFQKNGKVKLAYLFELSNEFVDVLAKILPDFPPRIMPNSTTDAILAGFLTILASAKGLDGPQAAAKWLVYHERGEILPARRDFYTKLGELLRNDPGDVEGFRECLKNSDDTVLAGSIVLRSCRDKFLKNPQAPGMLRNFLGDCSSQPADEQVTEFIDSLVKIEFFNQQGKPLAADAALFCSVILTAVFPTDFVDYRQNRWKEFAELFELEAFPKGSPYGDQILWASRVAKGLASTVTFKKYFVEVEPFWTVAGLAFLLTKNKELRYMVNQTDGESPPQPLSKAAKNLILYGPPGTGKTYISVQKAVEICDGMASDDRKILVERFRKLQDDDRIAFVTFHQSYGYEEFVEGIRPVLTDDTETEQAGQLTGVSYECQDGVFKKISSLARGTTPIAKASSELDIEGVRVWKMSLGNTRVPSDAYVYEECLEKGYVLLGYGYGLDFTGCDDREAVKEKLRSEIPDIKNSNYEITSVNILKNEIAEGDLIIVSDGNTKFRAIGRVTGEYEFLRAAEYGQKRSVEWLLICEESLPMEKILNKVFSQMTLYQLRPKVLKMEALRELLSVREQELPANHVLIIDEINRGNISKIMGELITLLEPDKRLGEENELKVTLPYSRDKFGVPSNLYIIGTMNTADRSIAFMDTALRRRFEFEEMMPDLNVVRASVGNDGKVGGVDVPALLNTLNQRIELLYDRDHQIGHSYLMKVKSLAELRDAFIVNIIPLLQEYFYGDWEKLCIVLGCPYSPETGKATVENQHPLIKAISLNAAQLPGANEDYEDGLRYTVNPDFKKAGEDELASYFRAVTAAAGQKATGESEE